jgi:site-specific recombinase XerC
MFDNTDKNSLTELLDAYGEHLSKLGKSRKAVIACTTPNREFVRFLTEKGVTDPQNVTEELLKEFQRFLYGREYKRSSLMFFIQHIRMFFDFLIQIGKLKHNEARGIEVLPEPGSLAKPLPRLPDVNNKDSLPELLDAYGEYLSGQGKSRISILNYQNPNRQLIQFLAEKGIIKPKEVTEELLKEFQQFLYDERDFKRSSVMSCMKYHALFFDFLIQTSKIRKNAARGIEILSEPELP